MGSVHELDFSERRDERQGRAGDERPAREIAEDYPPRRVAESGMTGGEALSDSLHEDNVTLDDLSPDTFFDFNVVPTDLDIYNPRSWLREAQLQRESRACFKPVAGAGLGRCCSSPVSRAAHLHVLGLFSQSLGA